jgi:hypothetical protein
LYRVTTVNCNIDLYCKIVMFSCTDDIFDTLVLVVDFVTSHNAGGLKVSFFREIKMGEFVKIYFTQTRST